MVDSDPQHTMDPDLPRHDYSSRLPDHHSLNRGETGILSTPQSEGIPYSNKAAPDGPDMEAVEIAHGLSQHWPDYRASVAAQSVIRHVSEKLLKARNREDALKIISQVGSLSSPPENVLRYVEHHLHYQSLLDTPSTPRSISPPANSPMVNPVAPTPIRLTAHLGSFPSSHPQSYSRPSAAQKTQSIPSTPNHYQGSSQPFAASMSSPRHFSRASLKGPEDIPNVSSASRVSSPPVAFSPKTTIAPTRHVHKCKGTNIMWAIYKSASQGRIDYPDTACITLPLPGDVYTHTDLGASNVAPQYWQYNENEGNTFWMDVTQAYELNNGSIRHPIYPERVLQKRNECGDPSYVLLDTFRKKLKKRIEAASQIVKADERAGNESSASNRMR
jgi:hypothetical protein